MKRPSLPIVVGASGSQLSWLSESNRFTLGPRARTSRPITMATSPSRRFVARTRFLVRRGVVVGSPWPLCVDGVSGAAGYLMGWTVEVEVRGLKIRIRRAYPGQIAPSVATKLSVAADQINEGRALYMRVLALCLSGRDPQENLVC